MSIIEKTQENSSKEESKRSEERPGLTTGPSEKRSMSLFFTFVLPYILQT